MLLGMFQQENFYFILTHIGFTQNNFVFTFKGENKI